MKKADYFVFTGAMGAGKSSLINELECCGFLCINEPARIILKEQRSTGGRGVPETDPELFNDLMLDKMIGDFNENLTSDIPVLFDRGIPDVIAYARLLGTNDFKAKIASEKYIYNRTVFVFNAWEEIYTNDEERKMSFSLAEKFGSDVKNIYKDYGYNVIDVPFLPLSARAEFIKKIIHEKLQNLKNRNDI